jgi:hypothetical protein
LQYLQTLYNPPEYLEERIPIGDNQIGNWRQVIALKSALRIAREANTRRLWQLPYRIIGVEHPERPTVMSGRSWFLGWEQIFPG